MDRYKQELEHIHVKKTAAQINMHLYAPVINLIVTFETHKVVTDVCVYLCLPGANMTQSLSSQPAALAAAWFNFSTAKNRLLQVSSFQDKH